MDNSKNTLDTLMPTEKAKVAGLTSTGLKRRRMLDLGFVRDAPVEVLYTSPTGNPTAYQICGTVIALRKQDAQSILVYMAGKEVLLGD